MKHDFGISVAVETASSTARSRSPRFGNGTPPESGAIAAPHDPPDLHVLPAVKWIFDPSFRYTPSYATDLRKTFERIRRQIQSQDRDGPVSGKAAGENVLRLDSRKTID